MNITVTNIFRIFRLQPDSLSLDLFFTSSDNFGNRRTEVDFKGTFKTDN